MVGTGGGRLCGERRAARLRRVLFQPTWSARRAHIAAPKAVEETLLAVSSCSRPTDSTVTGWATKSGAPTRLHGLMAGCRSFRGRHSRTGGRRCDSRRHRPTRRHLLGPPNTVGRPPWRRSAARATCTPPWINRTGATTYVAWWSAASGTAAIDASASFLLRRRGACCQDDAASGTPGRWRLWGAGTLSSRWPVQIAETGRQIQTRGGPPAAPASGRSMEASATRCAPSMGLEAVVFPHVWHAAMSSAAVASGGGRHAAAAV